MTNIIELLYIEQGTPEWHALRKTKDRFMKKVNESNGCWKWNAQIFPTGYGAFHLNGKSILAHRASYLIFNGEIPNGIFVCHKCDNKSCVNPHHLFLGSAKENAIDRSLKGRHGQNTVISNSQIEEIKNLYTQGYSQRCLAKKFKVHQRSIWRYLRRSA